MPAMPGTPWRRRKASRSPSTRQLLRRRASSRTITPRQNGRRLSSSSAVDAVVADVGVGEGDDLPGVGRVGDDLLVAGEDGVEHDLAGGHPAGRLGPDGLALEHRPVGQDQDVRSRHRSFDLLLRIGRSSLGLGVDDDRLAAETVWRTRPVSVRPGVGGVAAAAGRAGRVDRPGRRSGR